MITFKDFRNKTNNILLSIYEESTFYIYRTDTNAVLARGINGFEAAKARANQIRKTQNLKWDQTEKTRRAIVVVFLCEVRISSLLNENEPTGEPMVDF